MYTSNFVRLTNQKFNNITTSNRLNSHLHSRYEINSVKEDDRLEEGEEACKGTVESWCWPWVGKSSSVIGENRTRAVDVDAAELSLADM